MKTYFVSDEHFDHSNILKYCNRPFVSVEEMNETIIKNHNAIVTNKDEVYHLGDFAFRNHAEFLRRLNGKHFLIKGNHEGKNWKDANFIWVKEVAMIKVYVWALDKFQFIFLSHYAHRVWPQAHFGVWHLYGHSHNTIEDYNKSCDVGVDAWNFKPVSFEQLQERFKDRENLSLHKNIC